MSLKRVRNHVSMNLRTLTHVQADVCKAAPKCSYRSSQGDEIPGARFPVLFTSYFLIFSSRPFLFLNTIMTVLKNKLSSRTDHLSSAECCTCLHLNPAVDFQFSFWNIPEYFLAMTQQQLCPPLFRKLS